MKTSCGCVGCAGPGSLVIENQPGLSALAYRIGTYDSFFAAMKARIAAGDLKVGQAAPPLRKLKTRSQDDPAIAFLDVWAILADVLTFYQERIANEGYLRTATERKSIVNLAALVDYQLRPGVAASSYAAYTLDPSADNTLISAGSKIQSVSAATGELPQTFETSQDLLASGAYSNLAPRLARPQLLSPDLSSLYLAGTTNNVNQNDPLLLIASPPLIRRIADVALDATGNRTTITFQPLPAPAPAGSGTGTNAAAPAKSPAAQSAAGSSAFNPMDVASALMAPLQKAPASHPPSAADLRRQTSDVFQSEVDTGPRLIRSMHPGAVDLYSALANAQVAPQPSGASFAFRVKAPLYGHNAPPKPITNSKGIVVGTEEWPLGDSLAITISVDPPSTSFRAGEMFKAARQQTILAFMSINQGSTSASGTFKIPGTGQKIGNWDLEISVTTGDTPQVTIKIAALDRFYIMGMESETVFQVKTDGPMVEIPVGLSASADHNGRHLFVDTGSGLLLSDIAPSAPDPNVIALDSVYDKILPGSWVYIERADLPPDKQLAPTTVESVSQVSLNKFGVPARVTQLRLASAWLDPKSDRLLTVARSTTVYAQSEKLPLAEEPISDEIAGDSIELGSLYSDLEPGRWLIVSGERTDIPNVTGINGSELVMLASVKQSLQKLPVDTASNPSSATNPPDPSTEASSGEVPAPAPAPRPGESLHSFLQLASPLAYSYKRGTVTVYGNVVPVTHGETHNEVLGSGDNSQAFQQFKLHGNPLTYVSAATVSGAASTLAIFVTGIQWREIRSLTTAGPQDRVFVTSIDDQNIVTVTFGDGVHGMRPPTGAENITARYRVGIGSGGNLDAGRLTMLSTRPLGARAVTNPVPADGGADRDSADDGRRNTPLAAIALNRLVSVSDYAAFARTFAGVGKASSGLFPLNRMSTVLVSVAGAQGALLHPESPLLDQLMNAMLQFGDPHLPITILPIDPQLIVLSARVQLLSSWQWNRVKPNIVSALQARFNFDTRELGQPVFSSSIIAAIQNVPGVARCVLDVLDSINRSDFEDAGQLDKKFEALRSEPRVLETIPIRSEYVDRYGKPHASELAYLDPDLPETLLLNEIPL